MGIRRMLEEAILTRVKVQYYSDFFCITRIKHQLDATINRKIYCLVVQILLNMFRALQCPSSGARQTAVAASGFRMNVEVEVFSAMVG